MSMREMSEQRGPVEMTAPEAATGAPRSTIEKDGAASRDEVLARIPDLDGKDPGHPRKSRRSDGRLISQKLATRLLVGGVAVIALAAIIPSLVIPGILNKKTEAEGGKPTAPDAPKAPPFNAETARNEPDSKSYQPEMSFDFQNLQGPGFTGTSSDGGNYEPSKTPPPWTDAQLPELSNPNEQRPVPHVGSRPTETMWDNRGMPVPSEGYSPAPTWPPQTQPPSVNSPASLTPWPLSQWPPGEPGAPQARTNETMRINDQAVPIPGQYPDSDRPVGPVDPRSVPPGFDSNRPQQWDFTSEPGVARFEGIITKPPLRTTYHGTGSGVY
ncbi:MAG TPA: hypothetical protein VMY42_02345 [Thermoguttaceae bacterium]|nr:hypothetical protein [Thermoguttaceae bacterium]